MMKRAGLRAMPRAAPWWLRVARAYLKGLQRKDRESYRGIRGRIVENWTTLEPIWERLIQAVLGGPGGYRYATRTDAGKLCALVLECVVWWAAEERNQVREIRAAERQLLDAQNEIDRAVDALETALRRSEDLCLRLGLSVDAPMWNDDLGSALAEAAHRFPRWGGEPAISAAIAFERRSFFTPRPHVIDIVKAARSGGVLRSEIEHHVRNAGTGEWVRTVEPTVVASDLGAAEALSKGKGSSATSEAAQLRQLFAHLNGIALDSGWGSRKDGPLTWLAHDDISVLCSVAVGDGVRTAAHPWGCPSEGFEPETVRKAVAAFLDKAAGRKS